MDPERANLEGDLWYSLSWSSPGMPGRRGLEPGFPGSDCISSRWARSQLAHSTFQKCHKKRLGKIPRLTTLCIRQVLLSAPEPRRGGTCQAQTYEGLSMSQAVLPSPSLPTHIPMPSASAEGHHALTGKASWGQASEGLLTLGMGWEGLS